MENPHLTAEKYSVKSNFMEGESIRKQEKYSVCSSITLVWSLLEAARTIAWDLIPFKVAGFKLQITHTFRFCQDIA